MKKRDWQETQPGHSSLLMVSSDNHKTLVPLSEHSVGVGVGADESVMPWPQAQGLGLSCDSATVFLTSPLKQLFSSSPIHHLLD